MEREEVEIMPMSIVQMITWLFKALIAFIVFVIILGIGCKAIIEVRSYNEPQITKSKTLKDEKDDKEFWDVMAQVLLLEMKLLDKLTKE